MSEEEQKQAVRDILDESYPEVKIGQLTFTASEIVEQLDPIAFDCMVVDMEFPDDEEEEEAEQQE